MGLPWYLNPLWEWDLHDRLDMLEGSSSSSRAACWATASQGAEVTSPIRATILS